MATLREASQNLHMVYMKTMQSEVAPEAVALGDLLAMQVPQSEWKGLYRFFESLPILRHWVGDRVVNQLREQGFEVAMKPWESTLKIMRDDIEFNNAMAGYVALVQRMANEVKLHPFRLAMGVIEDGFAGTSYGKCFDGYALFSASHTTGTNTGTAAFTATALADAKKAMRAQADPVNGDKLLIEPTHLWYHPDLEARVSEVIDKEYALDPTFTATESNPHYKSLKKLPMLGLTSSAAAYWGLFSISPSDPLKPVLYQYRPGSEKFVSLDKDDDERNFMRREILHGVELFAAAAPGFPQYAWGSTGTT